MKNKKSLVYIVLSMFAMGALWTSNSEKNDTIARLEEEVKSSSYVESSPIKDEPLLLENVDARDANIINVSGVKNSETSKEKELNENKVVEDIIKTEKKVEVIKEIKTPVITNTVYVTNTGKKYHKSGCRYLKNSCTAVSLDQALSMGKTACSVCKP